MKEYTTGQVVDMLMNQKEQHDAVVTLLNKRIDEAKEQFFSMIQSVSDAMFLAQDFFYRHPELLPEYVARVYEKFPERARKIVLPLYGIFDLSQLPFTGSDFEPWPSDQPPTTWS